MYSRRLADGGDFANGGDDRVRPLKRDHVIAIGNHDSLAARRKLGLLHLQLIYPDLAEVVEVLLGKPLGQLCRIRRFAGRQNDQRFVAQITGCPDFVSTFRKMSPFPKRLRQ